jgi:hypothetical protein
VILSRYDIAGHELWAACSLVALVLWFGLWIVNERAPESRELAMGYSRAETATMMVSNLLLTIPLMGALILVLLGAFGLLVSRRPRAAA